MLYPRMLLTVRHSSLIRLPVVWLLDTVTEVMSSWVYVRYLYEDMKPFWNALRPIWNLSEASMQGQANTNISFATMLDPRRNTYETLLELSWTCLEQF